MRERIDHPGLHLLAAALLLPLSPLRAQSPDVNAAFSLGLDSNPAQTRGGESLFFARYAIGAHQPLSAAWGLDLDAWYKDYEGDKDSYRAVFAGDWQHPLADGYGLLSAKLEGVLYRDRLVPADARNELGLTLAYDHLLSARDELSVEAGMRRLAYRTASYPWEGRPGGGGGGPHGRANEDAGTRSVAYPRTLRPSDANPLIRPPVDPGAPQPPLAQPLRRDDTLATLSIGLGRHFSPTASAAVALDYADRDSQVGAEAYARYGLTLSAQWDLGAEWALELGLGVHRYRYEEAPAGLDRRDDEISAALDLRRRIGDGALFCRALVLDNRSSFDPKSFRQTVSECGLDWTF